MYKTIDQGFLRNNAVIERLVLSKFFWIVLVVFGFSIPLIKSIRRELPQPLPVYGKLGQFKFVNQFGKSVSENDFKGKVLLINFMFTRCPTVCPEMTRKMQVIQKRVRGLGQSVALVSVSVDHVNDDPAALFKYSQSYKANPYVWNFVTGTEIELNKFIFEQLKLPFHSSKNLIEITHSERIVLADGKGDIRGYYDSDSDGINRLMIDTGLLANNAFNYRRGRLK